MEKSKLNTKTHLSPTPDRSRSVTELSPGIAATMPFPVWWTVCPQTKSQKKPFLPEVAFAGISKKVTQTHLTQLRSFSLPSLSETTYYQLLTMKNGCEGWTGDMGETSGWDVGSNTRPHNIDSFL